MDVIRSYAGKKPMLGVCLGHQAIGEVFGAKLENLSEVYHGVATPITLNDNEPMFAGLPRRIEVGRYHSWVVSHDGFPACLEITAESDEGQIMGIRHKDYDIRGIQFHPESVLTPDGKTIIKNWLIHTEITEITEDLFPCICYFRMNIVCMGQHGNEPLFRCICYFRMDIAHCMKHYPYGQKKSPLFFANNGLS